MFIFKLTPVTTNDPIRLWNFECRLLIKVDYPSRHSKYAIKHTFKIQPPPPLSEGQKCKLLGLNISPFKCLHTQNTLTPHTHTTHTHRHTPSTWRRIKIKSLYGVLRMNRTEWLLMQGKVWWTKGTSFKKLVGHKPSFCDPSPPTEWILKQSKLLSTKGTSFENLVGHKPSFSRPPLKNPVRTIPLRSVAPTFPQLR